MKETPKPILKELAAFFLKLNIIGFGGPAAHIAMMQREGVTIRFMSRQQFIDAITVNHLFYNGEGDHNGRANGYYRSIKYGWPFVTEKSIAHLS